MSRLEYATSFRDLIVFRKARELSLAVFKLTEQFLKEETYSLTDQILGRLLRGMIAKAEQFCNTSPHKIQEEQANYFVASPLNTEN